jgi:hypothetical protein
MAPREEKELYAAPFPKVHARSGEIFLLDEQEY